MSTEMLDVLSVLDAQDNPVLNNCSLVLGEVTLEFKNGRSLVPTSKAAEVARCDKVRIPGYTGPVAPPVPSVSAVFPGAETMSVESSKASLVEVAAAYLREQGLELEVSPAVSEPKIGEVDGTEKFGIEVPIGEEGILEAGTARVPEEKKASVLPEGFEEFTASGERRCIVRTGNGTQCSNAATSDSAACGLPAHQEQAS